MKSTVIQLSNKRTIEFVEKELIDPESNEIQGQTLYSAISPGTELAAWQGKAPLRPSKMYPRLLGYCNLAKVLQVGECVEGVAVGDYILTNESHRSHFNIPASKILCSLASDQVSNLISLSTTYLFHLGYSALMKAEYFPGHKVAVVGFGALGYCTGELLHTFGASPVVFSSMDRSRAVSFNKTTVKSKTNQQAEYEKFDIVINTSDSWDDYLLSLELLKVGGICLLLGFPGRGLSSPSFNPLDSRLLYDKQLQIRYAGYVPECDVAESDIRFTLKRNLSYLSSLIVAGRLDTSCLTSLVKGHLDIEHMYTVLSETNKKHFSGVLKWN